MGDIPQNPFLNAEEDFNDPMNWFWDPEIQQWVQILEPIFGEGEDSEEEEEEQIEIEQEIAFQVKVDDEEEIEINFVEEEEKDFLSSQK